jgi:flagellar L-ring protein precursor FlgH
MRQSLLTVLIILGIAGCGGPGQSVQSATPPLVAAPLPPAPAPQEGSLWTPRQPHGLVADQKAFNVGDIITVSITESAKASEIANTQTSKVSGVKASVASLFGLSFPMKAFTNKEVNAESALEGAVGNTSKGEGKTERQSSFTTYLSSRVVQVLPNNHLVIQGQRHLRVNNETEVVTLTGVVRPQDIDRNNTVPSTKVADARLEMAGVGVVSDKQRQGWLTRIFDHIWPF